MYLDILLFLFDNWASLTTSKCTYYGAWQLDGLNLWLAAFPRQLVNLQVIMHENGSAIVTTKTSLRRPAK